MSSDEQATELGGMMMVRASSLGRQATKAPRRAVTRRPCSPLRVIEAAAAGDDGGLAGRAWYTCHV